MVQHCVWEKIYNNGKNVGDFIRTGGSKFDRLNPTRNRREPLNLEQDEPLDESHGMMEIIIK